MLEKKLNELNIFALRDLARKTGVISPTSKKKETLIKEIIDIMQGVKKPAETKTKQGRPPKVFGYDFANVFDVHHLESLSNVSLNQSIAKYENGDVKTVAGILELVNNNSAILCVKKGLKIENYFVASEVIKGLDLRTGDLVVAEVVSDENKLFVKSVLSVNDCPILKLQKRKKFYDIEHVSKNKTLAFKNSEIKNLGIECGQNVYVYGSNNNENSAFALSVLNEVELENKIYINISIVEKNKSILTKLNNVETFIASVIEDCEVVKRLVTLAIERAKRILEVGEDVLIVVDDMLSVSGLDKDNLTLVKNLVSISKVAKSGSITLVAIMPNSNISQIEKLADKRIKIENGVVCEI